MLCVDTLYFRTTGLEVLKGNPNDLALMQNAFISQSMARRIFGDEDPIGKELSVEKMFNVTQPRGGADFFISSFGAGETDVFQD